MWDDARQLNAIAVTLSLIALAFFAWALVGRLTPARLPGELEVEERQHEHTDEQRATHAARLVVIAHE